MNGLRNLNKLVPMWVQPLGVRVFADYSFPDAKQALLWLELTLAL